MNEPAPALALCGSNLGGDVPFSVASSDARVIAIAWYFMMGVKGSAALLAPCATLSKRRELQFRHVAITTPSRV